MSYVKIFGLMRDEDIVFADPMEQCLKRVLLKNAVFDPDIHGFKTAPTMVQDMPPCDPCVAPGASPVDLYIYTKEA